LNSVGAKAIYGVRTRRAREPLILSEGCLKALAIARAYPDCCSGALLGSAVTEGQIERIRACGFDRVVLLSDPDRAGKKGICQVAVRLAEAGVEAQLVYPVPSVQADELSQNELAAVLRNNIVPFSPSIALRLKKEICLTSA
jgi:DNA primase